MSERTDPEPQSPSTRELVDRVASLAERDGLVEAAGHLTDLGGATADRACNVVVCGEFKKGKSAVVNAILSEPVSAAHPIESTVYPVQIEHGATRRVECVTVVDGNTARTDLDWRTAVLFPPHALVDPSPGAFLAVTIPSTVLRGGVTLIDTPPLGGGLSSARSTATLSMLKRAHAVIFVTDASQELTGPELDFLDATRRVCPTAIVVETKTDCYPQWRRIVEIDREHLRTAGIDLEVLPFSVPLHNDALRMADQELEDAAGTRRFADTVGRDIVGAGTALRERSALATARDLVGRMVDSRKMEKASLMSRTAADEQTSDAVMRTERLSEVLSKLPRTLTENSRRINRDVRHDLTRRFRDLMIEVEETIDDAEPDEMADELEPWVHQRVNDELIAHHEFAADLILRFVENVTSTMELDTMATDADAFQMVELGDGVEVLTGPALRADSLESDRQERRETKVTALRMGLPGVSVGAAVGYKAMIVAGAMAAVPVAVVGVAFVGLPLALFTYRRGLRGELDRQKARAKAEIRKYIDDVGLDVVNEIEDELTAATTTACENLESLGRRAMESAASEVDKLSRIASTDDASRNRERERVENEGADLVALDTQLVATLERT